MVTAVKINEKGAEINFNPDYMKCPTFETITLPESLKNAKNTYFYLMMKSSSGGNMVDARGLEPLTPWM